MDLMVSMARMAASILTAVVSTVSGSDERCAL